MTEINEVIKKPPYSSQYWEELTRINAKYGGSGQKNLGSPEYAKELRKLFLGDSTQYLVKPRPVEETLNYWFAGIIEGEGSMNISLKKTENAKFGLIIDPEFSITQSSLSADVILTAIDIFKTGRVSWKQGSESTLESTLVYRIVCKKKLLTEFCRFYDKYCLKYGSAAKTKRYQLFKQFLVLMDQKKHHNIESFCSELLPIWSDLRVQVSTKTSFLTLKEAQDYARMIHLNKTIQKKGSSET